MVADPTKVDPLIKAVEDAVVIETFDVDALPKTKSGS